MSEVKNLNKEEAFEKLKALTENKICFLTTYKEGFSVNARPMFTQTLEDDGTIYFFSDSESSKVHELNSNSNIDLLYADIKSDAYLTVKGKATVLNDRLKIKELWSDFAKAWFEGPEDPRLRLIVVKPYEAYYWDTIHSKFVSDLKILFSALTGAKMDDGREGQIHINK
jgi:general stress protein 26